MTLFLFLVSTTALSLVLTWVTRELALWGHLLDLPTPRSSHCRPTPRLGGVGIAASAVVALATAGHWASELGVESTWPAFMVGGLIAATTGLADDVLTLRPSVKLVGQFAAIVPMLAVAVAITGPGPIWLVASIWVLVVAGYMNLFNFMDGSDGLAAGVAVVNGVALALLADTGQWVVVPLILSASALGFLFWNRPPASVFMGDAGSLFLGYGIAITGVMLIASGISAWAVGIALTPMLGDGTLTLILRLTRRERVWEAHRSHLYQRLLVAGWSHGEVASFYWSWAAATGAAAVAYGHLPAWGQGLLALAASTSVAGVHQFVRDTENRFVCRSPETRRGEFRGES